MAHLRLSLIAGRQGRLRDATRHAIDAWEARQPDADLLDMIAKRLFSVGELELAAGVASYDAVLTSGNPAIHAELGKLMSDVALPDHALPLLRSAHASWASTPRPLHYLIGLSLHVRGRHRGRRTRARRRAAPGTGFRARRVVARQAAHVDGRSQPRRTPARGHRTRRRKQARIGAVPLRVVQGTRRPGPHGRSVARAGNRACACAAGWSTTIPRRRRPCSITSGAWTPRRRCSIGRTATRRRSSSSACRGRARRCSNASSARIRRSPTPANCATSPGSCAGWPIARARRNSTWSSPSAPTSSISPNSAAATSTTRAGARRASRSSPTSCRRTSCTSATSRARCRTRRSCT